MVNQRMLNGGEQGDGSGLDADLTDGKEADDIGNSPDEETILFDENGDLQVSPKTVILGDFENNDSGSWTVDSDWYTSDGVGGAENTSYYMHYGDNSAGTPGFSRSIDFTDIEEIVFFYYVEDGTAGDDIVLKIGGSDAFRKDTGGVASEWVEVVVDTSTISGSQTIEFRVDHTSSSLTEFNIDRIKAEKTVIYDSVDGAGGT